MKNSLVTLLPALALLTLGGCAGTSALSTTESDGVYYSSKDRTTQNATAAVASTAPTETQYADGEISNPDYAAGGQQSSTVTESTEYYDDDYAYSARIRRFHQPYYRGFGYGYNDFMYADPFWYGGSPYYGNGFYDPFYGPSYGYGGFGGSFMNINIGFGSPWGWGYNPWRYGRGYGIYDSYYGGGYGGYGYGYGGYGGYPNYYVNNNYYGSGLGASRNVRYGARTGRSAEAGTAGRGSVGTGNVTGSRSRATGGVAEPTGGRAAVNGAVGTGAAPASGRGRTRASEAGAANAGAAGVISTNPTQPGQLSRQRASDRILEQPAGNTNVSQPSIYESRSRRRATEVTGAGTEGLSSQPQYSQPRRSRFSEINTNQSGGDQNVAQPTRRQRSYSSPQRTYEAPQRTYEAPQRTYEAPSRSYESPSRSSMPSGGGNIGGGNSGGGGRGRGRN